MQKVDKRFVKMGCEDFEFLLSKGTPVFFHSKRSTICKTLLFEEAMKSLCPFEPFVHERSS